MAIKWEKFFPRVMPEVKGCPAPIVIQAIRDAAREFCEKTWVWQEIVPFQMEKGQREVFISMPRGASLVSVKSIVEEGGEHTVPDDIFIRSDRNLDQFKSEASSTKQTQARGIFTPSENSDSCPDFLYNDHAEIIAHGVKARLMYDARKTWGHPDLAAMHHNMFRKGIANIKIYLHQGYRGSSSKVKPRRFV